jgi:hypothetical protein
MFTEKEITIIKALVEEEMLYSVSAPNRPDAGILGDYRATLSLIDNKITGAIKACAKNYSPIG